MSQKPQGVELKVGIFVFIGIAILTTFVLLIGDFKSLASGYNLKVDFGFINGVKVGAPVRFAGLDVGEVKEINVMVDPKDNSTRIEMGLWLKNNIRVPVDSTFWINTLGLLGEKYIEIMPGVNYKLLLKDKDAATGKDPLPMQEVTEILKRISSQFEGIITKLNSGQGTIGKLIYDEKLYQELEAFATDIRKNPWKIFWKTKEKK